MRRAVSNTIRSASSKSSPSSLLRRAVLPPFSSPTSRIVRLGHHKYGVLPSSSTCTVIRYTTTDSSSSSSSRSQQPLKDQQSHTATSATTTTSSSSTTSTTSDAISNTKTEEGVEGPVGATASAAAAAAVDDTAAIRAEELAKANFQKVRPSTLPLFPWRHSPVPLPRLDLTSDEFEKYGYLLGADIRSSNPTADMYATAFLFMKASIFDLIFFKAYKSDLAENMSWAFGQTISSILSNVYSIPLQSIQTEDDNGSSNLAFEHGLGSTGSSSDKDSNEGTVTDSDGNSSSSTSDEESCIIIDEEDLKEMIDEKLLKLYESAKEFGKESMNVKLEMTTTTHGDIQQPEIINLFVFPFLSRTALKDVSGFEHRYKRMIDAIAINDWTLARNELDDIMMRWVENGWTESTVIAQVLVPCDEIFYVKDAVSGEVLQGHGDEKARRVLHLVRFEMVVKSYLKDDGSWIPVRNELGTWKVTDIDDLLEGNLLL